VPFECDYCDYELQFHGEFDGFEQCLLFCRIGQSVFVLPLHFGAGATESVFVYCHCGALAFAVQITVTGAVALRIDLGVAIPVSSAVEITLHVSIAVAARFTVPPFPSLSRATICPLSSVCPLRRFRSLLQFFALRSVFVVQFHGSLAGADFLACLCVFLSILLFSTAAKRQLRL
jgi:hypothetical protein